MPLRLSARWARPPLRRIGPLDDFYLRAERRGLNIAALALLLVDRAGIFAGPGTVDLDAVRRHVAERVVGEPRLRELLVRTRWWEGPAYWVSPATFDVATRVRNRTVPPPGDEAALLRVCCELHRPVLDPGRAPWELWVLDGLATGQVALLLRLHHTMADGTTALDLFDALFDGDPAELAARPPGAPAVPGAPQAPRALPGSHARPSSHALVADDLRRRAALVRRHLARLRPKALPPLAGRIVGLVGLARVMAASGHAPQLPFNKPVTRARLVRIVRSDLSAARAAGHAHGGTVNDVLLVALAHGVRALLASRGEPVPGLDLHVSVATSLRRPDAHGVIGNQVGVRAMNVPLDEPDPARALDRVVPWTRAVKRLPVIQPSGRLARGWSFHVMNHQRLVNVHLSNLVGPPQLLRFGGAPIREVAQISSLQGNVGVSLGILSYAGALSVAVTTDPSLVPDSDVLVDGLTAALRTLGC